MLSGQKLRGDRFFLDVIGSAVWLYHRFTLSYRNAEELLMECGIYVTREAIRTWYITLSDQFAQGLRHRDMEAAPPFLSRRPHRHAVELRGGPAHHSCAPQYGAHLGRIDGSLQPSEQSHRPTRQQERAQLGFKGWLAPPAYGSASVGEACWLHAPSERGRSSARIRVSGVITAPGWSQCVTVAWTSCHPREIWMEGDRRGRSGGTPVVCHGCPGNASGDDHVNDR